MHDNGPSRAIEADTLFLSRFGVCAMWQQTIADGSPADPDTPPMFLFQMFVTAAGEPRIPANEMLFEFVVPLTSMVPLANGVLTSLQSAVDTVEMRAKARQAIDDAGLNLTWGDPDGV